MMTFTADRWPDNTIRQIHVDRFDDRVQWSADLFSMADPRYLAFDKDAGLITVRVAEGTATYQIVASPSGHPNVLDSRLVNVERPCAVCKRDEGKHQWWCTHAT